MKYLMILILLCNVAYAKPIRIQNKKALEHKKESIQLKKGLLDEKEIDKLTPKQIKKYLKEITAILEKLLNE